MVFNCYFSVVWLAFFDANEAGLPHQQHLSNVGSMAATYVTATTGPNSGTADAPNPLLLSGTVRPIRGC